jgi:hypothetical protein
MMLKREYTFTVKVPEIKTNFTDFVNSIKAEANDHKRQLELTHRINEESDRIYEKIFTDLLDELNIIFEELNVKPMVMTNHNSQSNKCRTLFASKLPVGPYELLKLVPDNTKHPDTMYTTYTGKYHLEMGSAYSGGHLVKGFDDILNILRYYLLEHYKKNK